MPKWWKIETIARQVCMEEISQHTITLDTVHSVLLSILEKFKSNFVTANPVEKKVLKRCMGRLWSYYHRHWDKEKQEGKLWAKQESFAKVSNFTQKYGNN